MDKASLVGVVVGVVCMGICFFEVSHGNFMMFYSLEGVLMVGGGSISVVFMAMPMSKLKCLGGYLRTFMFGQGRSPVEVVEMISGLSEKARRDGILALESDVQRIQKTDPFLVKGLRMAIDGMDPSAIEATLRIEILAMQERHKAGKKFFDLIKLYGPGWGLVGTLVGQVGMFGNLEGGSIGALGKSLAIAVCATMYGTVVANAICGPIGDKLGAKSAEEILNREMVLQGVMSLQAGDNPRLTLEKMTAFIPMSGRSQLKQAA
jgi:chemotaxis protein MotA